MASINKLAVRGIRSFSPDDAEQTVDFYTPVTMIVGRNGCGKTTIIEALRYAITGSFPPGGASGKSGQAFVHDPRGASKSTVKASVKLRFVSRAGKDFVVNRAMELTQKKSAVSFKQLDGVLRYVDEETGQTVKASHKCGELDKQVPTLLGISKAILDNVLFVHQEEASWPLMEGAVLKKRFDEIFDSTRYTKALDIIRKTEKDLRNDIKEILIDLSGLDARKDAIRGYKVELAEQNDIEEGLQAEKTDIHTEIERLDARIGRLSETSEKVQSLKEKMERLSQEHHRLATAIDKQKGMLEEDLSLHYSLDEIKEKLRDFDDKVSRHKSEQDALLEKEKSIKSSIDALHSKEMDSKAAVGRWAAKKEAHEQRVKDRFLRMERLAQTFAIDLNDITQLTQGTNASFLAGAANESFYPTQDSASHEITPEAWAAFKRAIKKRKDELDEQLREHQQTSQNEDDGLQREVSELLAKIANHENDLKKIENRRTEINRQMPQPLRSHGRVKLAEVEEIKQRAESYAKQRQDLLNSPRRTEIPIEIRQLEDNMEKTRRKLDEEKRVLETLRDNLDASNAIKVLEEECEKDFRRLEDAITEESSAFQEFNVAAPKLPKEGDENGDMIVEEMISVVGRIESKYDSQNNKLRLETEEQSKRQNDVTEATALTNRSTRALSTYNAQLSQIRARGSVEKVRKVIEELRVDSDSPPPPGADEQNPDALIAFLDELLAGAELQQCAAAFTPDIAASVTRFIKKKAKIASDGGVEHICPCCARGMDPDEHAQFKSTIKSLLFEASQELSTTNPAVNDLKLKVQEYKAIVQSNMADLREFCRASAEVSALESDVEKLRFESDRAQKSFNDQKGVVEELQKEVNDLRALLDSARRWNEDANRIADKRMKIGQKRVNMNLNMPHNDQRDLRTVERQVTQLSDEKDTSATRINALNKEMSILNAKIADLSERANQTAESAKNREATLQKQQEDEKKRKDFEVELKRLRDDEVKIDDDLLPLKRKLKAKELEKQRSRSHRHDHEKELTSSINEFQAEVGRLYELAQKVDDYAATSGQAELDRVESELEHIAADVGRLKGELQVLQPEIARANNLLKDQEREKSQLQFNIAILEQQNKLQGLEKEISQFEEELNQIPGQATAIAKLDEAEARKRQLLENKALLEGRYSEIVERIRSLKRKLSSHEYKDVDEQHRVATIKKETTQIAADDLKKYEKALDQALLQYHSVKIAEVNKLIRELWMTTYKGEDITNIEIVSGQEAGSKAAKSYNYRVVMTKGNTDLDMRGRCSAGQRVLASLVIRLALAETFGVYCGCIALDEPTVNLDFNNKKGLSQALAQLVEHRAKQKNFQLVLITHDEEFVDMMKNELQCHTGFNMPEHYFRVSRQLASDGKYYSKINKVDWDEEN